MMKQEWESAEGSLIVLLYKEEAEESDNESDEEEAEESHAEEESDEEESDDEEESESDEEESDEEHESNEEEESDSSDDRRGNSSTKRVVWSDRIKSVKKIEYGEDELMWKQEAWGEIKARKEENKQGRKEEEKIKKCQTKRLNVYAAPLSVPPSLPFLSLSLLAFPPMDYDYVDPTIFSPSLPPLPLRSRRRQRWTSSSQIKTTGVRRKRRGRQAGGPRVPSTRQTTRELPH